MSEKQTEENTQEVDSTTYVYITVKGGEVVSVVSNNPSLCVEVIDRDLGDIDKEIAEANEELESNIAWLEENSTMYELISTDEETEAAPEEDTK